MVIQFSADHSSVAGLKTPLISQPWGIHFVIYTIPAMRNWTNWGWYGVHSHFGSTTTPTSSICFLSFSILCFSHNHTHPFITGSTPILSLTHSITHTNSLGHIPAKTERSPQTRFWTGANRSIDSRSSSSRSFSTHIHHSTTSKSATLDTGRNTRVKTRVSFPHPKIDFFILTLFSRFITKSFHIPHSFHRESERVGIGSELGWRNREWYWIECTLSQSME